MNIVQSIQQTYMRVKSTNPSQRHSHQRQWLKFLLLFSSIDCQWQTRSISVKLSRYQTSNSNLSRPHISAHLPLPHHSRRLPPQTHPHQLHGRLLTADQPLFLTIERVMEVSFLHLRDGSSIQSVIPSTRLSSRGPSCKTHITRPRASDP